MSVPSNTFQTFAQSNIREDLIDLIYNVDPYNVPIFSAAKRTKATQTLHEWDTDVLASQDLNNAAIEGDDATADSLGAATRLGNQTQISQKVIQISDTSQAVKAAGGSNKMGYQRAKAAKALKRDIEGIITNNQAKSAGTAGSAARNLAGLPSWLGSNTQFQTGGTTAGADPATLDGAAARTYSSTDGQVAISEDTLKAMLQSTYKNSGETPEYLFVSPANKQNISAFTGPGTRFTEVSGNKLPTSFSVYESDFGNIKIVPDIFLATSGDCYAINPQYLKLAYLRPFTTRPLAKTGDSAREQLVVEYTLEVGNEKAHGAIYDTTG